MIHSALLCVCLCLWVLNFCNLIDYISTLLLDALGIGANWHQRASLGLRAGRSGCRWVKCLLGCLFELLLIIC